MYVFNPFLTVYVLTPPDGLPSIIELLRVIINILDPADQMHTDSTRLAALGILNTMFDVAGPRMGDFPSLIALVIDYGCKYLFQLVRSDNPAILNLSLRTISTMFETMRSHLKLQQELFLAFTIDRLAPPIPLSSVRKGVLTPTPSTPSNSSPLLTATEIGPESRKPVATPRPPVAPAPARGETREIMLETLKQISRHPSFMVDLYVNYDCDPNCDNMFERLIEFLTQVGIRILSLLPKLTPTTGGISQSEWQQLYESTSTSFQLSLFGHPAGIHRSHDKTNECGYSVLFLGFGLAKNIQQSPRDWPSVRS